MVGRRTQVRRNPEAGGSHALGRWELVAAQGDEDGPHRVVAAWLRGLGLEQYAPAFRDNNVDGEVLPALTADDLISIGVTSVGHRRKLLAAIAALATVPPNNGSVTGERDI